MKRRIILFSLLFLFAGTVYLLLYPDIENPQPSIQECNTSFAYDIDKQNIYMLSSKNMTRLFAYEQSRMLNTKMDGILNVRFVQHEGNTTIALMQLSELSLHIGDHSLEEALKQVYSQLFITRLAPDGHILDFYFRGDDKDSAGLAQLVSQFQIVLGKAANYVAEETTYEGKVRATYSKEQENPCFVRKQRHGFDTHSKKKHRMNIIRSDINASVDKEWIRSFTSLELIEVTSGKRKMAESRNVTSLHKTTRAGDGSLPIWRFDGDIDQLIAHFQNDDTESYLAKAETEAQKQYVEKNVISLDTLLLSLKDNEPRQLLKIAKYLTLYPEHAKDLFSVIKNASEETAAALINVLALAGTPQAQAVLRDIIQDEDFGQRQHIQAIIALGNMTEPTKETVDFLWKTYDTREDSEQRDCSNTAVLSAGRLAKKTTYGDEIRNKLNEAYENTQEDGPKKRMILLSMQNAGAGHFLSEIFEALDDSDPHVRSAAVKALSAQNTEEVRSHLLPLFKTDEAYDVRYQMVKTLLTIDTNDPLMSKARENILQDDDSRVRYGLIRYLLKYKDRYPENIDTLKELRKKERDRDNQILLIKNGF